ncbi:unnamed protein product [Clavelina lepadiformis]|uniref:HTH CENPB-type domain-containing protein n=1 Tax=Clavelina lepadiformis TaxID=159417 RepID=A0ABP0G0X0_CLALP
MENVLAQYIGDHGFSSSVAQIQSLVKDYIRQNKIATQFKNDLPGRHWVNLFMQRNVISLKMATLHKAAEKLSTANPFDIFNFYECISKVIKEKNLGPEQI